jgi:hypothetical protein
MTINLSKSIICTAAIFVASAAFGQTQVPVTFQAGQPALAADVNANFTTLESAVNQNADDISLIESQSWMGDWQTGLVYAVNDLVQFQGSSYVAVQATTGIEDPTDAAFWSLFAAEGAVGLMGPQGPQGLQGNVGPQGIQGLQGDVGLQGPQGLLGPQGIVGPQGTQGLQGNVGPQGSQGLQGPDGPVGPAGADAVIDPALVQTRVSGTCAVGSFIVVIAEDGSVTCGAGGDVNDNTRYGVTALSSITTGQNNSAFGFQALLSTTDGFTNAGFGTHALRDNTSGHRNVAVGSQALMLNTIGFRNVAVGMAALQDNTDGNYNTAVGGGGTLGNNTTGADNTAIGASALFQNTTGDNNTATGSGALASNGTGSANTAVGYTALNNHGNGDNNTAFGYSALWDQVSGSSNIALGGFAGSGNTTGSFNISIGSLGVDGDNNTTRIGTVAEQTRAIVAGIRGVTTGAADAIAVVIDSNGQLGTVSSSLRYKEDVSEMGEASGRLLDLNPVTFRYRKAYDDGERPLEYGLIAEEVAEVFPELVVFNDENQPETVKYRLLSSMLLNELQKQHSTLSGQVAEIDELKDELAELRQQVSRIATNLK